MNAPLEISLQFSEVSPSDHTLNGNAEVRILNHDNQRTFEIELADLSYKASKRTHTVPIGGGSSIVVDTQNSHNWYDIELRIAQLENFQRRFAGRVETGQWSYSDPAMGKVVS